MVVSLLLTEPTDLACFVTAANDLYGAFTRLEASHERLSQAGTIPGPLSQFGRRANAGGQTVCVTTFKDPQPTGLDPPCATPLSTSPFILRLKPSAHRCRF